ncbi:MAG: HNH endonuclease [Spirochaetia bacterium]|jgi:5-methylcytosine-specific restriction endonuclease McrA|nr:HNH endonuclease [Spirochaetia bacterium]
MSDKKKETRKSVTYGYSDGGGELPLHISREKQKARKLRHSPWWKKKVSAGICYYCGQNFPPAGLTMDHKIPLSKGGFSEKINIVPCCKECNSKKKYLMSVEWDEYMKNLGKPIGE